MSSIQNRTGSSDKGNDTVVSSFGFVNIRDIRPELSRKSSLRNPGLGVKLDSHTWACRKCRESFDLMTDPFLPYHEWKVMLFQVHDKISSDCKTSAIEVWVTGAVRAARSWIVSRSELLQTPPEE